MIIKGVQDFARELLWQPVIGIVTLLGGVASVLAWINVGENWTVAAKTSSLSIILLFALLSRVLYVAYSLYTEVDQLNMKVDRPLRVRKVQQSTHYHEGRVTVILERRDTVSIGDILTLFVREGDAEIPICLLSVEAITSQGGFPQSVVLQPLTQISLPDYLSDESRLEQLQAKRSVTESHWEEGIRRYLE